jgi:FkbM family methyltransferase
MLITPQQLTKHWGIQPNSVLHVGAHMGEEKHLYLDAGWEPVIWVEAQAKLAARLKSELRDTSDKVFHAAIWDQSGIELELNISSNSASTSLLQFGSHKVSYPEISFESVEKVNTIRLDQLLQHEYIPNFLNLDIQGVELQALVSLGEKLNEIDYIYVEINSRDVYLGCTKLRDLDKFLVGAGFKRISTRKYLRHGWGEALYCKKKMYKRPATGSIGRLKSFGEFYGHQCLNFMSGLVKPFRRKCK